MKKLAVALAALLVAFSANAQRIGVVAGLTSSKTNASTTLVDVNAISLYHIGLTCNYSLDNFLAVQPAIIYNMKGAKLENIGMTKSAVDFKTGFVEIPIQLQVGMGIGDLARAYGFVEPYVGYAVSNKIEGTTASETWDNIKNKFEYGIGVGVGVEVIKHVQLNVKYYWDMGTLYGTDLNFTNALGTISTTIGEGKCSGITASVVILL